MKRTNSRCAWQTGFGLLLGLALTTAREVCAQASPGILVQPQSQTVVQGTNAAFRIVASGQEPLVYRWYRDGMLLVADSSHILGADTPTLDILNVVPADAGNYWVTVSNRHGMATSVAAKLTVLVPPAITSQPQSLSVPVGGDAAFTVGATGSSPLSYQWRFNGTNLTAATASSLVLTNVQPSAAGSYSVLVSNSVEALLSSNAVLTVLPPPCATAPAGLVSWWRAEGDGSDFASGNTAVLLNGVGFTNGRVGQAFYFNGIDGRVTVADAPALDVSTNDFSIETWIRPLPSTTDFGIMTIVCKRLAPDIIHSLGYELALVDGRVNLRLSTSLAGDGQVWGPAGPDLRDGQFHHVAVSLVRNSPTGGCFYVDSQAVLTFDPTGQNGSLSTSEPLRIGNHATSWLNAFFKGQIDEVSLYARALAASEIQDVYRAEHSGKCVAPVLPVILSQPTSVTATAGDNVSFSVRTAGTQPLSYQWQFNGTNLSGATASSLGLANVQLADAGSYRCLVSNAAGTAASSNAALTVLPKPPCVPVPAGAVGWWPAENSVLDAAGGNHGTVAGYGTFGYAPGFVGQAFVLDGTHRDRVDVGDPANLHLQQFTIEAWVKRASATEISLDDNNQDGSQSGEGGIVFGYGRNGYGFGLLNDGRLFLSRIDVDGVQSTSAIADTNWHHILVIKGAGAALFFLDGTLASGPIPYVTTYTFETSAAIGSRGDARGGTFWGMIDEPAVYDHALSTDEILALYAAGRGGKCALPPGVLTQPTDQVATAGDNVSFSVTAAGTPPLSYQWRLNGTDLIGATAGSLVLTNVQPADAGSYSVLVSNNLAVAVSSNAVLTVNPPPPCAAPSAGLVSWWRAENDCADQVLDNDGTLRSGATFGAGRVRQAFKFNGTSSYVEVPDSPSLRLTNELTIEFWVKRQTLNPVTAEYIIEKGGDWLQGSQNYGMAIHLPGFNHSLHFTCNGAWWGVAGIPDLNWHHCAATARSGDPAPAIYIDGVRQTVIYHEGPNNVSFNPSTRPLHIGAQVESVPGWCYYSSSWIDELSLYHRALTAVEIQAIYQAERSGKCTTPTGPVILAQPTNWVAGTGNNTSVGVTAAGTESLFYQWRKDGQDLTDGPRISGAQSKLLTITGVETNDAGGYQVVITNAHGAATSEVAVLSVVILPSFVLSPSNQTWTVGSSAMLTSLATGTEPLTYQWYRGATQLADDARLSGTAGNILSVSNVLTSDAGSYAVVASNAAGFSTSAVAVVTVITPPSITAQPRGYSVPVGMPVQLSGAASGTAPLSYQWRLNGTDLPGATSNVLNFAALTPADFGNYQLVVTNLGGAATSAVAQLTRGPVAIWGYYSVVAYVPIWPAPGLSNVITIAGGGAYSLALRGDGTIYAWGNTTISNFASSLSGIVAVAAGDSHAVAVRSNGTVVAWGSNSSGQTNVPAGLSNIVAVTAGSQHCAALRADGTVVAWGGNSREGQANIPPGLIDVSAIDANGVQTLALREDGTVVGWGGSSWPTPVPPYLHGVAGIAAGYSYNNLSLALLTNGSLAAWHGLGLATNVPGGLTNLVAVAVAGATDKGAAPTAGIGLAVRSNSTVVAWGSSTGSITNVPVGLSNAVAVAGGITHALALENEGAPLIIRPPVGGTFYSGADLVLKAKAVGNAPLSFQWFKDGNPLPDATNDTLVLPTAQAADAGSYQFAVSNALGVAQSIAVPVSIVDSAPILRWPPPPFGVSGPPAVMASYSSPWSVGASVVGSGPMQLTWRKDGAPIATGTNQLYYDRALPQHGGAYSLIASNSFGAVTSSVVQVKFSRIASWGYGPNPTNAPFDPGTVLGAASGYFHALAIQSNRTVVAWGTTSYGATNPPAGLSNVLAVSAGSYFSVALKNDGTVAAWGLGSSGQTNVPPGLSNVVAISAGASHTLALRADGTVAAWGYNSSGQANVPAGLSNVVAVAAGSYHSMALRNDGSVALWGQYGKPPAYTNVAGIAGGYNQCLVLQADGTVVTWSTTGAAIILPGGLTNIVAISAGGGTQGYWHSVALRANGELVAWGNNYYGQLMIPPDLISATAISAGGGSTLAYLNDRSLVFTVQPWSLTVASGTNVTLRALTVGRPSMRYQWYANGQALMGATKNSLSFTNTHPAQSGAYQLVAMNDLGAATSGVATLTVTVPPVRLTPVGPSPPGFRFSFTSLSAVLYIVEFKDDLAASTWSELERRFGIGGLEIVTDASVGGTARFYRVRALYAPSPSLGAMTWTNGAPSFSFATVSGAVYVIHYKERLEDAVWLELSRQTGTGEPIVVSDPDPAGPSRFYRVQVE